MGFFSLVSVSHISLCTKMPSISGYLLCIPLFSQIHLLSWVVFGGAYRVSMYGIMSFANNDSFTSSFAILVPFISSSCLITVAKTSTTMLNKSGVSRHPCLILDFKENTFTFSLLNMMIAVVLPYTAFIILKYVSAIPT